MTLCKCGHEQSKHTKEGCIGCSARCKTFEEAVITGAERVRRQEIIAAKLRQAQEMPKPKTIEEDTQPIQEERKSAGGKATRVWQCSECGEDYEDKESAADCCVDADTPIPLWGCSNCMSKYDVTNRYDTKEEANECDCKPPKDESSDDDNDSGSNLMSYVGAFIGLLIVIIIAVSVVIPTVITAVASPNSEVCAQGASNLTSICSNSTGITTGTVSTILSIIPLMIAVVILLLVVAMIGA